MGGGREGGGGGEERRSSKISFFKEDSRSGGFVGLDFPLKAPVSRKGDLTPEAEDLRCDLADVEFDSFPKEREKEGRGEEGGGGGGGRGRGRGTEGFSFERDKGAFFLGCSENEGSGSF